MNRATADAAGRFRFDDLYDGTFEVRATDAAGTSAQGKVTSRSGVEDLVVAFDASQTVVLAGRVVDDATGEPIREFSLTCMKPDKGRKGSWSGTTKKFNAADGSFRYGGIEPGQVELSVDADGYARLSFGKQDYAAGTHELEARLAQARTLSIQVERADGRPFQNGNLTVTDAQGRRLGMNFGTGTTTSIDVGREPVHLAGLPARLVTIHVEHENETFDFDFDLRAPIVGTQTVIVKPKPEPPEVGLAVIVIDSRVNAPGDEPPYIRDAWELDLEDAQGRRLSRIDVKPAEKGFDIRTRTGSNASHATRAEPVAELRVRTTVATGKLRIGTAAPIVLTVPAPDPDGRILWVVDVSKL
jgi:hypothetical protein